MSDWAEDKAREWLTERLGPRIKLGLDEEHVISLATLLRDAAKTSLERAQEWSNWAVQYKEERDEMYGLLNSSEIRRGQVLLMHERDEARAEVARLKQQLSVWQASILSRKSL